jgi:hypothetical protein
MIRICWSGEDPESLAYPADLPADLLRGSWAGDRFDVVAEEIVNGGSSGAWEDNSQEICDLLRRSWQAFLPSPDSSQSSDS